MPSPETWRLTAEVNRLRAERRKVEQDALYFRTNYASFTDAHRRFDERLIALNQELTRVSKDLDVAEEAARK